VGFCQTDTCEVLSLVNGSPLQPAHRRWSDRPAMRLYRSAGFEDDGIEGGEVVLWREL